MEEGQFADSRRKKKLIAVVLLSYDPWSKIFKCSDCSTEKHARGCTSNRREVVQIPCICNGQRGCDICHGRGTISYKRCPSSYPRERWIYELLPYYYRYRATNEYPDRRGRLYQSVLMVEAFELMSLISSKKEMDQLEKSHGRK